jgi:hypothetical protein
MASGVCFHSARPAPPSNTKPIYDTNFQEIQARRKAVPPLTENPSGRGSPGTLFPAVDPAAEGPGNPIGDLAEGNRAKSHLPAERTKRTKRNPNPYVRPRAKSPAAGGVQKNFDVSREAASAREPKWNSRFPAWPPRTLQIAALDAAPVKTKNKTLTL